MSSFFVAERSNADLVQQIAAATCLTLNQLAKSLWRRETALRARKRAGRRRTLGEAPGIRSLGDAKGEYTHAHCSTE